MLELCEFICISFLDALSNRNRSGVDEFTCSRFYSIVFNLMICNAIYMYPFPNSPRYLSIAAGSSTAATSNERSLQLLRYSNVNTEVFNDLPGSSWVLQELVFNEYDRTPPANRSRRSLQTLFLPSFRQTLSPGHASSRQLPLATRYSSTRQKRVLTRRRRAPDGTWSTNSYRNF